MDSNTVLVIALFAVIVVAVVLVFRDKITIALKGPAGTGLDVTASNAPTPPTPGALLEHAKSRKGGATVKDGTGRGAVARDLDVDKDINVTSAPRDPKA